MKLFKNIIYLILDSSCFSRLSNWVITSSGNTQPRAVALAHVAEPSEANFEAVGNFLWILDNPGPRTLSMRRASDKVDCEVFLGCDSKNGDCYGLAASGILVTHAIRRSFLPSHLSNTHIFLRSLSPDTSDP